MSTNSLGITAEPIEIDTHAVVTPVTIGIVPTKLRTMLSPVVVICITVVVLALIAGVMLLHYWHDAAAAKYVSYLVDASKWAALLITQLVIGKRINHNVNEAKVIAAAANDNASAANLQLIEASDAEMRIAVTANEYDDTANDFVDDTLDDIETEDSVAIEPTDDTYNNLSKESAED